MCSAPIVGASPITAPDVLLDSSASRTSLMVCTTIIGNLLQVVHACLVWSQQLVMNAAPYDFPAERRANHIVEIQKRGQRRTQDIKPAVARQGRRREDGLHGVEADPGFRDRERIDGEPEQWMRKQGAWEDETARRRTTGN